MTERVTVLGRSFARGYYTSKHPAKFKLEKDDYFANRLIVKGSWCRFFETRNFGFVYWITPDGEKHLASQ